MTVNQLKTMSRRGFIGLAGALALLLSPLRRLQDPAGGGSAEAATEQDPILQYALTGGWATDGFLVTAQLDPPGASASLAVSTTPDMQNIIATIGPVASNVVDGLARFTVTGLTEQDQVTRYYCQLQNAGQTATVGDAFSGWARMKEVEADYSFDIVLGSCLGNPNSVAAYGSQLALQDAADLEAPLLLHLGDWGYWGQDINATDHYTADLAQYTQAMNDGRLDQLRRLVDGSNVEICISDHELHANGDRWQAPDGDGDEDGEDGDGDGDELDAFGCRHSIRQMTAHRRLFPVRAWGDATPTPAVHRGYWLDLAPHVRLVVSDFRSPQRNESTDDEGPTYKQMWGATQEQWLYEEAFDVAENVVILFVSETAWWRRADGEFRDDKPASYPDAQRKFMDRLKGTGDYTDYPPLIGRFVWLGGDRHYCGYLSTADAQQPPNDGFPQFIGSGFCKDSLPVRQLEAMSWQSPVRQDNWAWFPVVGYMKLTLAYDASTRTVTLTGTPRIVETTHHELTTGTMTGGCTTVSLDPDSTEVFRNDDVNQFITGHHIPDQTDGLEEAPDAVPAMIVDVSLPKSATMSVAAEGTSDDHYTNVRLAIGIDRAQWSITTPSGSGPVVEPRPSSPRRFIPQHSKAWLDRTAQLSWPRCPASPSRCGCRPATERAGWTARRSPAGHGGRTPNRTARRRRSPRRCGYRRR